MDGVRTKRGSNIVLAPVWLINNLNIAEECSEFNWVTSKVTREHATNQNVTQKFNLNYVKMMHL